MKIEKIKIPAKYFQMLGGLHDAQIDSFMWDDKGRKFTIAINDINAGFLGLPEYTGRHPAEIIFIDVLSIDIDIQKNEQSLCIYDLEVADAEWIHEVSIKCAPSGLIKLNCREVHLVSLINVVSLN